jgi:hypothetical protein
VGDWEVYMKRTAVVLCAMIAGSACTSEEERPSDTLLVPPDTLSIPICSSFEASDAYALGDLALDGHDLLVHVQFRGGCASHTFAACLHDRQLLSDPPGLLVGLSHDAHGDPCDALLRHDLRIDITPIAESSSGPVWLSVRGNAAQLEGTTNFVILED